jgi:hypothetical protein
VECYNLKWLGKATNELKTWIHLAKENQAIMITNMLLEKLNDLPPEKQEMLLRFAESLVREEQLGKDLPEKSSKISLMEVLRDSEIVGMWKDRPEMEDSVQWVRQLRKREWRDISIYDSDR